MTAKSCLAIQEIPCHLEEHKCSFLCSRVWYHTALCIQYYFICCTQYITKIIYVHDCVLIHIHITQTIPNFITCSCRPNSSDCTYSPASCKLRILKKFVTESCGCTLNLKMLFLIIMYFVPATGMSFYWWWCTLISWNKEWE